MLTATENGQTGPGPTGDLPGYIRDLTGYARVRCAAGADRFIEVFDPATNESIGSVPAATGEDVRCAVEKARTAFDHWKRLLPQERGILLRAWGDGMLARKEELAALLTAEQGKPLAESLGEIEYSAGYVHWYAEEARRVYGEQIPSHLKDCRMTVAQEPVGVVATITPWNFPSAMLVRKASAAMAAGCTVIAVPSSVTPFSALAAAEVAEQAGVPANVLTVLTGKTRFLVPELCRKTDVRAVSFTGSTEVGREIATLCAATIKRVSLELGGHAPFIVFPDADLEAAVAGAVAAKFVTTGQDCLAANRIYVHDEIHDAFCAKFVAAINDLKVGPGNAGVPVDLGPLVGKGAFNKVREHIGDATAKGARVLAGGNPHELGGLFHEPTVLGDVTPDMKISHEETFGPIAAILRFSDYAEVVRAANDTEYGLIAYAYTRDHARALRISDDLEFGMVAINTPKVTGAPVPFGGVKQSGLGREGSHHGIREYTQLKYVCAAY